nr:hypothetical protein [Tanacetum cinerariifolium]
MHKTHRQSLKTSNSSPKVTDKAQLGNPQYALKDKGVTDSGCSRHMTGNMSYLSDFQELNGGYVAFGGNPKGGKSSGKGKIKTEDKSKPNDPQNAPSFVQTSEHTPPTPKNYAHMGYNKQHASFTKNHPQKHIVPAAVLTKSKPVSVTAARPVSAVVPKIMVTKPRHACSLNTKSNSTIRTHKTCRQSLKTSNSSPKVTDKAQLVSVAKGKRENGYGDQSVPF